MFHFIKGGEGSLRAFFVKLFGNDLAQNSAYRDNVFFEKLRGYAVKNRFEAFLNKLGLGDSDEKCLDLLRKIFCVEEKERISVEGILEHEVWGESGSLGALPVV